MRILSILVLFLCLQNNLYSKSINLDYSIEVESLYADSNVEKSTHWALKPRVIADSKFTDNITLLFEGGANIETGSSKSLKSESYAPSSKVKIDYAYLDFSILDNLNIHLGALDQEEINSPIFLDDDAMTGLKQIVKFNFLATKVTLSAQQLLASGDFSSDTFSKLDSGTPSLLTESLTLANDFGFFKTNLMFTYFTFNNITRDVIDNSRKRGNSVTGIGQDGAIFTYAYEGHNSTLTIDFSSNAFTFILFANYLHNNKTPNSRADGIHFAATLGFSDFKFLIEKYKIESDATIADYNDSDYGDTNRDGIGVSIEIDHGNKFTSSLSFHNQKIVNTSLYQAKRNLVILAFEKGF